MPLPFMALLVAEIFTILLELFTPCVGGCVLTQKTILYMKWSFSFGDSASLRTVLLLGFVCFPSSVLVDLPVPSTTAALYVKLG